MPERDGESIRKAALPWYGKIVIGAYLKSHQARYGEDFLELVSEGYRTYVDGNARTSMIVTGEALLRILYARIAEMLQNGPLTVRQGARTIRIRPSSIYDLQDELTFAQAERALSAYLDPAVYEQVDAVRFLRNRAAHADLPMLDEWDPRDQRSAEDFFDLLSDQTSIPEAYRFHKGDTWVTIFVKDHPCNTMHDLSTSEKLAAIQQLSAFLGSVDYALTGISTMSARRTPVGG